MKMNKIIAGVMACCIVCGGAPVVQNYFSESAIAATNEELYEYGDWFYYILDNDEIMIRAYSGSDASVEIPNEIDGKPVTSISYLAFQYHKSLESIEIPDSVTDIGMWAFDGTKWLENKRYENPLVIVNGILIDGRTCEGDVAIPDSVTRINVFAFNGCESLESIEIPKSVTIIQIYAFDGCTNLKDVYYSGTKEEWNKIEIYDESDELLNATIHFADSEDNKTDVSCGDTSGDGMIDAKDASIILAEYSLFSTGGKSVLSDEMKKSADVNGDGLIDAKDASVVLAYYSYLSTGGEISDLKSWLEKA